MSLLDVKSDHAAVRDEPVLSYWELVRRRVAAAADAGTLQFLAAVQGQPEAAEEVRGG